MSNEMIAMLLQFLMMCVFATAIRSVNMGKPGKGVGFICGLFCAMFTLVIYALNTHTLVELAPFVRDAFTVVQGFLWDGFVSLNEKIKALL